GSVNNRKSRAQPIPGRWYSKARRIGTRPTGLTRQPVRGLRIIATRPGIPVPFFGSGGIMADSAVPRILIADDNLQGVELLEAYLSDGDYDIRTAADGEETLHQIQDWQPDLILLDIMMPKISGFEVCKRIRSN